MEIYPSRYNEGLTAAGFHNFFPLSQTSKVEAQLSASVILSSKLAKADCDPNLASPNQDLHTAEALLHPALH
jgi:hypothetical protein